MSTLDEVSTAIGGLEAQMGIALAMLERREITGETLRSEVRQLQEDVRSIKADVAAITPIAQRFEKFEQRVAGIAALVGAVVSLIGMGIVEKIRSWL